MTIDLLSLIEIGIGIAAFCLLIIVFKILQEISRKIDIEKENGATIPEPEREKDTAAKLALDKKMDYLYNYFRIKECIKELDRFTSAYVQFLDDVEEELNELKRGKIYGPEYFRRQRLVEFALNMALVYARVENDTEMIPKIERYWRTAKNLH